MATEFDGTDPRRMEARSVIGFRLARSTFDLFAIVKQIVDAKGQFRSLAEPWADTAASTGPGRLMIAVLGGLADVERDLIRTRTAEGRSRAKAAYGPTATAAEGSTAAESGRCYAQGTGEKLQRGQIDDFEARMTQEKQPSTPSRTTPKQVGRAMAFDSAEHLFAAFPILVAIANWTGRIGVIFIKRLILSGKIKEARRNAAIIAVSLVGIVVLLLAFMMWLALLK